MMQSVSNRVNLVNPARPFFTAFSASLHVSANRSNDNSNNKNGWGLVTRLAVHACSAWYRIVTERELYVLYSKAKKKIAGTLVLSLYWIVWLRIQEEWMINDVQSPEPVVHRFFFSGSHGVSSKWMWGRTDGCLVREARGIDVLRCRLTFPLGV